MTIMDDMKPSLHYDHAYAVVRIDTYNEPAIKVDDVQLRITVKEVVWGSGVAQQEVARLNSLNHEKGSIYLSHVTRVEKRQQLASGTLAALLVDALCDAGVMQKQDFERAVAIVAEEIDVRKALGDY